MPQAVVVAAIPAVAAIAGGVISARAQGKARDAALKANEDAIKYQQEQQKARQNRYDAAYEDYRKRYDEWLSRFFGGDAKATTPAGGVRASSGAGGAIPPMAGSPGMVSAGTPQGGASIADLIAGRGQLQGQSALDSGNLWGQTLNNAGQGISSAILKNQKPTVPPVTINGAMQPGVDQGVMAPWQPALADQKKPSWADWGNYGAGF